jgi:O-succinylbenzoic acid--CoA ligase
MAPAVRSADGDLTWQELADCVATTAAGFDRISLGTRIGFAADNSIESIVTLLALHSCGAVICPISPRWPEQLADSVFSELGIRSLTDDVEGGDGCATSGAMSILFSSGSEGVPKGVVHTVDNHYWSAVGAAENIPLAADDCWLLSLPVYHIGGFAIVCRCLLAGATLALPGSPGEIEAALDRFSCTHLSLVPTQLRRLLDAGLAVDGVKAMLIGGAPCPADLLENAVAIGLPVCTTYGSTEAASQVTTSAPGERTRAPGCLLPYRDLNIHNGEIRLRGRTLFAGYAVRGGVEPALDEDGWFATGDLGRLEEGYLVVTGRKDNMFISGGENIQPEAIERVLLGVPGVEQAVVVAVSDAEFGHRPAAFIDGEIDEVSLREAVAATLPRFMVPDRFLPWPDTRDRLKVLRKELAEIARER